MKQDTQIPVTAVFDIGRTNKKFFLFDDQYQVVQKQQTALDQTEDEDGEPCEDLTQLVQWVRRKAEDAFNNTRYKIRAMNFSGYGATLVHLDENGEPVTPLYNYLRDYPQELLHKFYDTYGGRRQFSIETASPPMGMLNSGLQLYWLKHRKPHLFSRIKHTLHLPQYISYLFNNKITTELTSIGCHTGLWNFNTNSYHSWLKDQGIQDLLPPPEPVKTTTGFSGQNKANLGIGIGIHDSSAALAPYLEILDDPFLLISTGTWSISFNPFNDNPLTYDQLQRDCLCYLNIYGEQVKASRLFLGQEYMHQKKKLESHFNREATAAAPEVDRTMFEKLINDENPLIKLQLEEAHGSGPYPDSDMRIWDLKEFTSYSEAYHQLMLDLVSIQGDSIELIDSPRQIENLIVTGGFSQNEFFMKLLATRFPDREVYSAELGNASALGAAMVIRGTDSFKERNPKELLGLSRFEPMESSIIENYRWHEASAYGREATNSNR
ncbi:MAG: FGGY family carbohydrate kinase [Balneolaceae bacterium]|nr:FGGY family carbohydrate kinase [Balneolaceae bacterium]